MADITKTSEKDLQKELVDRRKELRNFRFGIAGSKVRNVREGRALKKNIARILTELNVRKANN